MIEPALEPKIAAITKDIKRKYLVRKLHELVRVAPTNATNIIEYTVSEQIQFNIKPATCENRIKVLIWLSEHHHHKPIIEMTTDDIQ